MTNKELVQINKCLNEILDSKEIKQGIDFKVIYAVNKNLTKLKKPFQDIVDAEKILIENYNKELVDIKDKPKQDERGLLLNKDVNELHSKEVTVDIHKIDESNDEVILKHLTGESTLAYLNFLTTHQD